MCHLREPPCTHGATNLKSSDKIKLEGTPMHARGDLECHGPARAHRRNPHARTGRPVHGESNGGICAEPPCTHGATKYRETLITPVVGTPMHARGDPTVRLVTFALSGNPHARTGRPPATPSEWRGRREPPCTHGATPTREILGIRDPHMREWISVQPGPNGRG